MRTEVLVVGAGPAGIATAIHLRRAGREVLVVDKAAPGRDKICGDGLTASALRELELLGLDPTDIPSWQPVHDVVVRSPLGHRCRFPLPRGSGTYAAIARRAELDAALVQRARAEGVEVTQNTAMLSAVLGRKTATVELDSGRLDADYVVGADGMWSPLRRALGHARTGYRGEWHAFRQYFTGVSEAAATELFISFEADLLPGYFWSFPLPGGGANVGFGIQRGHKHRIQEMGALWPDLLARPHIRELLGPGATPETPHRAWPIPAAIDQTLSGRGRALYVGDAAAACDPMTGEGIGQALVTGRMAANAITAAFEDPPQAQWRYRESIEAELVPDHRMSALLIRALQHRKGVRVAVRVAGATNWTRTNFARWLFEDEPRGVLLTPRRWHRDFLGRPGAYR
ncbi:MAG: NAD(P)/FAD-dependent oxidoreductase [Microthrixaceae bacterium]|nr:NAD(P)/FAD-dependent oxidoreductase [Microthrixaceae bacterium]